MNDGIYQLRYPCGSSWTGMFLVLRESGNILIDTAFAPAVEELLVPELRKLGLTLGDLDYVVNTHVHADHISGNAELRRRSRAKFAAFELAAPKLRDPYVSMNAIRSRFAPELPFHPVAPGIAPLEPDLILQDGDLLCGLRLVATPGHDSDEVSWFDEASGTLFSGDALQGRGTLSAGVAFYQNRRDYLDSIARVEKLAPRRILAGHLFVPTDGVIEDVPAFLRLCRDTVFEYDRVLRKARPDCRGIAELVTVLLNSCGLTATPSVPVLAWHTVAAHIKDVDCEN